MLFFRTRSNIAIFLALASFSGSCSASRTSEKAASAEAVPEVAIAVTEKACDKMNLTVNSGKNIFIITNASPTAQVEWEIIEGVKVVEEAENMAPGFVRKLKANLKPGVYGMICGRKSNAKGKLTVKAI
jgi:iron uptake system component EfeO